MTSRAAPSQWPYWILGLAVLGGLAWYGLRRPKENAVAELPRPAANQPSTTTVGMAPADLSVGGKNLATEVNASVGTLRSVLPGITDSASAQAALPKIQEAAAQLNEVGALSSKLTPEGKSALAKIDRGFDADDQPDVRQGAGHAGRKHREARDRRAPWPARYAFPSLNSRRSCRPPEADGAIAHNRPPQPCTRLHRFAMRRSSFNAQ